MKFYKKWPQLWPSLIIVAAIFIIWDHYFTLWGIWFFNPKFVLGWYLFGLPIEEWMFFITIPYACMFVYETIRYYNWVKIPAGLSTYIIFVLIFLLYLLSYIFIEKLYTCITFAFAASSLGIHWLIFKKKFLDLIIIAYLVQLIPFLLVNGILTSWPVLIYNDTENLGIRIGTIPVEDAIYSMIILILNITFYELLSKKFNYKSDSSHA